MAFNPALTSSAKPLKTEIGRASHGGMVRSQNEDSLLTTELYLVSRLAPISFGLYAVADGVGGSWGGEIASNLALRALAVSITSSLLLTSLKANSPSLTKELLSQWLVEGIEKANSEVYYHSRARGKSMGTTLTTALVANDTACIANVGDSRVYLLENEQLRQITTDHSVVADLVAAGKITAEEIYTHPRRNVITQCLGTVKNVQADLFVEQLNSDSSLLLCSDGLWEMVRDSEIKKILPKSPNPQAACEELVELANLSGGTDNVSVIVVKLKA